MLTSASLLSAVMAICLLLAVALLTAWKDFSLRRHVVAWACAFLVVALTNALRFASSLFPLWGDFLMASSCLSSISSFALLAWGFRQRAELPTRVIGELWGICAVLMVVLCMTRGLGWMTASRLLTAGYDLAMLWIIVGSLRGTRGTTYLAKSMLLLCGGYLAALGVVALSSGMTGEQSESVFRVMVTIGTPVIMVTIGILTLLILAADLARELRLQAWTDTLTGLLNRRGFEQRISEMRASRSFNKPTLVILADLDRFKNINDTLGHAAGDAVLRRFARQLSGSLQGMEIAARIGGEEFVILLPAVTLTEGVERAETLRRAVPATMQDLVGIDRITASFGIALMHPGEGLDTALARADVALYASKNQGRDRITCEIPLAA